MPRHTYRSTSALTFTLVGFAALLVPSVGGAETIVCRLFAVPVARR